MRGWIGILVGVALLVAAFLALLWFERSSTGAREEPAFEPKRPAALERSGATASIELEPAERSGARAEERPAVLAPSASRGEGRISGRVIDFADRPVVDATVEVFEDESRGGAPGEPQERRGIGRASTDAEGRFELRAPRGRSFELDAAKPGLARVRVDHCSAGEELAIRLVQSPKLAVRARRADGAPAEGVLVRVMPIVEGGLGSWTEYASAATDGLGVARFADLPVGPANIVVEPMAEAAPPSVRVEFTPGASLERQFDLEPGDTVRGRVVDGETKAPVAGARVGGSLLMRGRVVVTDAQGEYAFPGVPPERAFTLYVDAQGFGRASAPAREANKEPVRARVDFELVRAHSASGRVLAPDGKTPLADVRVEARGPRTPLAKWDRRAVRTREDGRFELANLRADVRHTLWIQARGFARIQLPFPGAASEPAQADFGDIVLQPGACAAGRVLDAERRPVPAQRLRAIVYELEDGDSKERRERTGELLLSSDHLGRFELCDLPAGRLEVAAEIAGVREAPRLAVALEAGVDRRDLVLVVDLGLTIRGRVVDPSGAPIPTVNLTLRKADGTRIGHSVLRTGSDGAFLCPALDPGLYQILIWPENRGGDEASGTLYVNRILEDVAAGTHDLVVRLDAGRFTRGIVRSTDGRAVPNAYVCANTARGSSLTGITTDAEGRFQLLLSPNEVYELEARPPASAAPARQGEKLDPATFARTSGVRGGAQDVELRLP